MKAAQIRLIFGCWFAGFLSGCATAPDDPRQSPEAIAPLVCGNKALCDHYWQRAQVWIAANSAYKIQLATDTVIQTYGPIGAKVDLAYLITKVPSSGDSAQIVIYLNCANFIRCYPTRTEAVVSFKQFVRGDAPPKGLPQQTPVANKPSALPQTNVESKYQFSAEQWAKGKGCDSPVATMNAKGTGFETFTVRCGSADPVSVRCEYGTCRGLN